jgi:1-acyl-sn-glycerol-3-phosphate acyltransferase
MFYALIKLLFWPWRRIYFRISTQGMENFPLQGPVIVVANHASYLDAGILGGVLPRKIHFVVLTRMLALRRLRWFYTGMQTIAVDPGAGQRGPIRQCVEVLRHGHVLGIFPEGSRSEDGRLGELQEGAALLAKLSGAPVIPIGVQGAFEAFPRGVWIPRPRKIRMRVGKALSFADTLAQVTEPRDALRLLTSQMRAAIEDLAASDQPQRTRAPERAR